MMRFIYAVAVQVGFIIGAGIFSIPYVYAQAGIASGVFWTLFLGAALMVVGILYGKVIAKVSGRHRLPGYAGKLLGIGAKWIASVANIASTWCALVVYMIVGGTFLHLLVAGQGSSSTFWYVVVFFIIFSLLVIRGVTMVRNAEFWMTGLLGLTMMLMIGAALRHSTIGSWQSASTASFFLPYGIILFALGGSAAIPVMYDIVGRNRRLLSYAIAVGVGIATVLTLLFGIAVVGVSGINTSPEALAGMAPIVGNWIVHVGAIFGLLAIATSYIVLGLNLEQVFKFDLHTPRPWARVFSLGVPFIIFFAGARDFFHVIDINGVIFLSIENILTVALFWKIMKGRGLFWKRAGLVVLGIIFLAGFFAKMLRW